VGRLPGAHDALREESAVDPNEVRRLGPGTAFALGDGQALKLQIDPAPGL
jgi:hypothetical protein